MKNIKRTIALMLTLCMVIGMIPAVFAQDAPTLAAADEVVIYYTNDVHTYIDGKISYDNLAWLKGATAEQAAGIMLVDAGDFSQGTAYGSMDKGQTIIDLMNATGYDLATLGNHEFDYGMDGMWNNWSNTWFPYISCNFVNVYLNPFEDVPEGKWYTESIKLMYEYNLIYGVTDTLFAPDRPLTRGQFATILWRAHSEPEPEVKEGEEYVSPFVDVKEGLYYTDAVAWANSIGIVSGTDATHFSPDAPLTREMMVAILFRMFDVELTDEEREWMMEDFCSQYTDFDQVSAYARDAMLFAVTLGLVSGVSETRLAPKNTCTRGQCAKILCPVLLWDPADNTVFSSYDVWNFDIEGEDGSVENICVAFVGITTPESFTKSTPAYFQDEDGNYIYDIYGGEDGQLLYDAVQRAIDEIKSYYEADYIIGLGHLGDDPASQPWTSEEVIANTVGLDALIDGHSHSTVPMKEVKDAEGNTVVLTQTGEYFNTIGRMSITAEGIKTELIGLSETGTIVIGETDTGIAMGSDEAVAQIKNDWIKAVDAELGEVIGYAEVTFDNYDADKNRLVRKQETNTGDFAADALYYLFDNMGMDVDVAIMNGGGVRNKAITGELSYKTCKEIHTFGNVACLQTITGQQLLDALEWGARGTTTEEIGGFLHVSGITYTIDPNIESTVQMDDKGVWTGGPTGEYRVKNVKILQDGEWVDLDLDAKYNLAGYNYTLRDLGDGFAMFDGAVNVVDYVMEDYMVLANYVKSFPVDETTGLPTITAENSPYGEVTGEGRIKIISEIAE